MAAHDLTTSASFATQANALFRKNLTFQKRNMKTNCGLVAFPFLLCLLVFLIQTFVNHEFDKPEYKCGCACTDKDGHGTCVSTDCGIQYSSLDQVATCPVPTPFSWPAFLQVPAPEYRAVRTNALGDLPNESCRMTGSCPATILLTGGNQSIGERISGNFFTHDLPRNTSDLLSTFATILLGSDTDPGFTNFLEPAIISNQPIYIVQSQCAPNSTYTVPIQIASTTLQKDVRCVECINRWCKTSSVVNKELYNGYRLANKDPTKINEILAAYDFLNTNENNFNVGVWYNSTYSRATGSTGLALLRVPRSLNMVSNAYLQFLRGSSVKILLDFFKEMPKPATKINLDFSSILGALFFSWVIFQLFPVILTSLVYEKQNNLRIMMKMHGLGDGPYWLISYAYFLILSMFYMLCFVTFGSAVGLKFFTLNSYIIQFVFFFMYVNLQIAVSFLLATMFSNVKTATVVGQVFVFGSGLLGASLFQSFVQDTSFPMGTLPGSVNLVEWLVNLFISDL